MSSGGKTARETAHAVQDEWLNIRGGHADLLRILTAAIEARDAAHATELSRVRQEAKDAELARAVEGVRELASLSRAHDAAMAHVRQEADERVRVAIREMHKLPCLVRSPDDATWIKLTEAVALLNRLRSPTATATPAPTCNGSGRIDRPVDYGARWNSPWTRCPGCPDCAPSPPAAVEWLLSESAGERSRMHIRQAPSKIALCGAFKAWLGGVFFERRPRSIDGDICDECLKKWEAACAPSRERKL